MEAFLTYYLQKNNSKSEHTKKALAQAIKRIEKDIIKKPFADWQPADFANEEMILDSMVEEYSLNTIIQNLLAIIRWFEYMKLDDKLIAPYKEQLNELVSERNKHDYK
jgi:site-specific recombinase XerD